ncbi:GPI ethanolamine phosphate transferase 2 isoform X6 [Bacillus rossius redtenbacheri]|uniref:GPI ethanolamine phosphate transferase 2 isoform X6 n=1 Tax=Bacillus rossius redtenbacheri TaxID=93214 RepID=UPI002FDE4CCD
MLINAPPIHKSWLRHCAQPCSFHHQGSSYVLRFSWNRPERGRLVRSVGATPPGPGGRQRDPAPGRGAGRARLGPHGAALPGPRPHRPPRGPGQPAGRPQAAGDGRRGPADTLSSAAVGRVDQPDGGGGDLRGPRHEGLGEPRRSLAGRGAGPDRHAGPRLPGQQDGGAGGADRPGAHPVGAARPADTRGQPRQAGPGAAEGPAAVEAAARAPLQRPGPGGQVPGPRRGAQHARALGLYSIAAEEMSAVLAGSLVEFDECALAVASALLAQVCLLLLFAGPVPCPGRGECLLSALLLAGNALLCAAGRCRSVLCAAASSLPGALVAGAAFFLLACNSVRLLRHSRFRMELPRGAAPRFLAAGTALHTASLAATSFVEEEHQTWYLLWPTLVLLASPRAPLAASLAALASHRALRALNQTGDKWSALPDLHDWLSLPGRERYLLAVFVAGLLGLLCCCWFLMPSKDTRALSFVAVLSVFCYRAAVGNISISFYPQSRGVVEARVFWGALCALLASGAYRGRAGAGHLAGCWALASALLHRPHNAVLVPALVLFSSHAHHALWRDPPRWASVAHVWLGQLFYFYQGNSNSFASIDVAAGYVGLQDYHPYLVGALLVSHTYSAPVLSYLLLLSGLDRRHHASDLTREGGAAWGEACRAVACARVLPLAVYAALTTWQRHHLFVWTVFSPKLLYEAVHTAVTAVLLLLTAACFQVK